MRPATRVGPIGSTPRDVELSGAEHPVEQQRQGSDYGMRPDAIRHSRWEIDAVFETLESRACCRPTVVTGDDVFGQQIGGIDQLREFTVEQFGAREHRVVPAKLKRSACRIAYQKGAQTLPVCYLLILWIRG